MTFQATVTEYAGAVSITLKGELDLLTAPELRIALNQALATDATLIVLDLRGLEFIDSIGLHVILQTDTSMRGGEARFVIVRGNAFVQRIFDIMQLEGRLELVDDPASVLPQGPT